MLKIPAYVLLTAILLAAPAAAQGKWPSRTQQQQTWVEFDAQLKLTCEKQHLEWLTYGGLNLEIETYTDTLAHHKKMYTERSSIRACEGVDMGISCANTGFLYAIRKDGTLPKFVRHLCSTRISCSKPFECTD